MNIPDFYQTYSPLDISIDTRTIRKGDVYVAIKGNNFDGNAFVTEAFAKGARLAVVSNPDFESVSNCIYVPNTLVFLQRLAYYHRKQFSIPVLAITGSNGKTTTKNLIQACLSRKFRDVTTIGNLNNHIGVPLSLLRIDLQTEIAVIEMGANHVFEIQQLAQIAQPTHGVITNIGKAHLEGFGGELGVLKGKSELAYYLEGNHGTYFLLSDEPSLSPLKGIFKSAVEFTINRLPGRAGILSHQLFPHIELVLQTDNGSVEISSTLFGPYNFKNIMNAIAIALYFEIDIKEIKTAIERYEAKNNRSQIVRSGKANIMMDSYNANPTSMKAAIHSFLQWSTFRKYLILGEMKELGISSIDEHNNLVKWMDQFTFETVILFGSNFKDMADYDVNRFLWLEDFDSVKNYFSKWLATPCDIFIKGSRASRLERLIL